MQGVSLSEGMRRSLALAREEAIRLQHEYVGTEHMLLGMLKRGDGVAWAALEALKVDADRLATDIERVVKRGAADPGVDLPYTGRAKRALELALRASHDLGHPYVGSEHVLLGMIDEKRGIAAQVLARAGVTREATLAKVLEILSDDDPA